MHKTISSTQKKRFFLEKMPHSNVLQIENTSKGHNLGKFHHILHLCQPKCHVITSSNNVDVKKKKKRNAESKIISINWIF